MNSGYLFSFMYRGKYTGTVRQIKNLDAGIYSIYEKSVDGLDVAFGSLIVFRDAPYYTSWLVISYNAESLWIGSNEEYNKVY